MTKKDYAEIEAYMLSQMHDSAHDKHHIYRVLNSAVDIFRHESSACFDVLAAACLLHDIGRKAEIENPATCHAKAGSEMAYAFLLSLKWPVEKACHVRECIASHRYRVNHPPKTIEAKILFDADKIDAAGAIGIARTLIYKGTLDRLLYEVDDRGSIITDNNGTNKLSFFQEYNFKLKKIYDLFYTERAKEIATQRQKAAVDFYNGLFNEVSGNYENGMNCCTSLLSE